MSIAAVRRACAIASRLRPLPFALLFALLFASAVWVYGGLEASWSRNPPALVNPGGNPIGRDFVAFWSASSLALAGEPAAPYDPARLSAAERDAVGIPVGFFAWFYPPIFLVLALPLATMPYLVALGLWLAVPVLAFARLLRRAAPHPLAPAAALIFPGTAQCLISGQNGIISAALITGGLLHLERRPVLAGVFFGTLTYKPQIAATAFAALLFGRHWRTLGAALATVLVLAAASAAAFGVAPWMAFLAHAGDARIALETGQLPWPRMVTTFAAARLAGAGIGLSYALHGAVAGAALVALTHAWRQSAPLALRGTALVLAIPLVTPFAYDYDLVMLLLAIASLVQAGAATGFRRGEIALLVLVWASPVAGWLFAQWSHILLTPILLALLLWTTLRRLALTVALAPA